MYTGDMTGDAWQAGVQDNAAGFLNVTDNAHRLWEKWYAFTYGKSTPQIATATGKSEAWVADMQAAFGAFTDFYSAMHNSAVTARDRETDLIKFV